MRRALLLATVTVGLGSLIAIACGEATTSGFTVPFLQSYLAYARAKK